MTQHNDQVDCLYHRYNTNDGSSHDYSNKVLHHSYKEKGKKDKISWTDSRLHATFVCAIKLKGKSIPHLKNICIISSNYWLTVYHLSVPAQ